MVKKFHYKKKKVNIRNLGTKLETFIYKHSPDLKNMNKNPRSLAPKHISYELIKKK